MAKSTGTFIYGVTKAESITIREIASRLGFLITRGPGAGIDGSMAQLWSAIAKASDNNPCFAEELQEPIKNSLPSE